MAFSRSEDQGIQSVSVPCSPSVPPTSPVPYALPKSEDIAVDADGIERWLTSPSKAASLEDLANKEPNGKSPTRLRLADVTVRRKRQQMQRQNQPSPSSFRYEQQKGTQGTPITSPEGSLRRGEMVKEVQHKEQAQCPIRHLATPYVSSSQTREHFRRSAAMTIAAMENNSGESMMSKDFETSLILSDDNGLSHESEDIDTSNERLDATVLKRRVTSPGIAAIRRRRQQRLKQRQSEDEQIELEEEFMTSKMTRVNNNPEKRVNDSHALQPQSLTQSSNTSANNLPTSRPSNGINTEGDASCDEHNHVNAMCADTDKMNRGIANSDKQDGRVFSVSRTKKIHLLKRHDAGGGGSPLVRKIDHNRSSQDDASQITIHSNENAVSTIARLRMIRRQMADGNNKSTTEHQHELNYAREQRAQLDAVDSYFVTSPQACNEEPKKSETLDDDQYPIESHDNQDQCLESNQCDDNSPGTSENKTDSTNINVNNTKLIKDALARSRAYRRSVSKRNFHNGEVDDVGCGRKEENAVDDDDELTTTTSVSETTSDGDETYEDGVSQPSSRQESKTSEVEVTESLPDDSSNHEIADDSSTEEENPTYMNHGKKNDLIASAVKNDLANSRNESIFDQKSFDPSFDEESIAASTVVSQKPNEKEHRALQEQVCASRIKLHVYDLVADDTQLDLWGCHFPLGQVFNAFNSTMHSIGTGAYHVGLEINGIEYAYGANNTRGLTGIFTCMPRCSPGYQFRTTIDFGNRVVKKKSSCARSGSDVAVDGQEIVRGMATEYLGTDYDLLRKNCCTFAHDVCIRLGIEEEEIPSWFHNLAAAGAITQDAANYTLAPITQLFAGNEMNKFTDYINDNALNDKIEAIEDVVPEDSKDHEFVAESAYQF